MKKILLLGFTLLFSVTLFAQDDYSFQQERRLSQAAHEGDIAAVKQILSQASYVLDQVGNPVEEALSAGHNDIARLLLRKGYSPYRRQPIVAAAEANNLEGVRLLLEEYNVRPDGMAYDFAPLEIALGRGYEEMVAYLLNRGVDKHVSQIGFREAISNGYFDLVKLALENGMIDPCDIESSLRAVLGIRNPDMLDKMGGLLLKYGARLDYAENYSMYDHYIHNAVFGDAPRLTVLQRAVKGDNVSVVDWLLAHGADPRQPGHDVMSCAENPKCTMHPAVRSRLLKEQRAGEKVLRELRNFFRKNPVR